MKKTLLAGLLCLFALAAAFPSAAQTTITVRLLPPQIEDFPRITAYLDVHSPDGFVHGLQAGDIAIMEDGQKLPVDSLEELNPGVQFVIAITPGYTYDVRDGQGISRFEHLVASMSRGGWEDVQDDQDDFSLVIAGGPEVIHTSDSAELLDAMRTFEPPHGEIAPDLEVLSRAIDIATDPTPQPGMERAVLFVTPPLLSDATAGLQSLAGRANQLGVRLFIWLLAPPDYFPLPGATQLRTLAEQSNGSYFGFSGNEDVPTVESYLEPLRYIYSLTYESQAAISGNHQFSVDVSALDTQVSSTPQNFSLDIAPPNPILVSPPLQIERTYSVEDEEVDLETLTTEDLIPDQQSLRVRVEFPDGYERRLTRTVLLVDGTVADENSAPPFEEFTWDLSTYNESGQHLIQVEAIDQLGLSGKSIERAIQITVPTTTQSILTTLSRQAYLIVILLALLILALIALGMVLSGRVRPHLIGRPDSTRRKEPLMPVRLLKSRRSFGESPVEASGTQAGLPVPSGKAAARATIWQRLTRRLRRSKPRDLPKAFAFLIPLVEDQYFLLPAQFQIVADEVAIGCDAEQTALTLDEPAVEPVHTRLVREGDNLRVLDKNTTAGTWVNYERIPPEGALLKHGDLLHIGRVGFRFALREPGYQPKPVITPLETSDDDHHDQAL